MPITDISILSYGHIVLSLHHEGSLTERKKKLDPKEIPESGYYKIVCHVTEIGPARKSLRRTEDEPYSSFACETRRSWSLDTT